MFADDTSFTLTQNDAELRVETLNCDLQESNEWSQSWKVKIIEGKTEQLNFTRELTQNLQLISGSTIFNTLE